MPQDHPRSIGTMNGNWARLLKAALIAFPLIGGSGVYSGWHATEKLVEVGADITRLRVVVEANGNRLTAIESSRFSLEEGRAIRADIAALKEQGRRIERIEGKLDELISMQLKGKE